MNVVLMILDALRYDHVTPETTPNLFELGRNGAFFTTAFSCNSSTRSSMPCILGGRKEYNPDDNIATVLGGGGVHTAMIHSNPIVHAFYPGYKETIDLKSSKRSLSKELKKQLRRTLPPSIIKSMKKVRAQVYEDDAYLPYARAGETLKFTQDWMTRNNNYFLWVHLMEPHIPYYPLETETGLTKLEMRNLNDKFIESVHDNYYPTPEETEYAKALYREDITEMDREIGEFMQELDPETLLVVTADHGEEFGEYRQFSHHEDKIIPELIHVPLIFHGGGVKPRRVDDSTSHLIIAPTILEAVGMGREYGVGRSLWGKLTS